MAAVLASVAVGLIEMRAIHSQTMMPENRLSVAQILLFSAVQYVDDDSGGMAAAAAVAAALTEHEIVLIDD